MSDIATLRQYFHLGEDENVISRPHFIGLSAEIGMSQEELEIIFTALDTQGNDVITLDEFLGHWNSTNGGQNGNDTNTSTPINSPTESDFESSCKADDSFESLSLSPCPTPPTIYQDEHIYGTSNFHFSPNLTNGEAIEAHCASLNNGHYVSPYISYSNEDCEIQSTLSLKHRQQQLAAHPRPAGSDSDDSDNSDRAITPTQNDFEASLHERKDIIMDNSNTQPSPVVVSNSSIEHIFTSSGDQIKRTEEDVNCNHILFIPPHSGNTRRISKRPNSHKPGTNSRTDSTNTNNLNHVNNNNNEDVKSPKQNKVVHVMSRPKKEDEVSPFGRERKNSIRVLKTENSTKVESQPEILAPVQLELKPTTTKRIIKPDRPFSVPNNETVFEYDSSKMLCKTGSPTVKVTRKKSPRQQLIDARKSLQSTEEPKMKLPLDLEPLSQNSQEQVCELYQNLHSSANPDLVAQFENILLNVIKDVRQYKMENERLEKTYRKEKDEHDKHLRQMEEEMEQQVQNIEHRVRKQEKERLESEKIDLRVQLDSEINMLHQNLKKLQQDGVNKMDKEQEEHLLSMKKRLEEIQVQNRLLKSELTDAQTNLALVKTEMTSVKQQLDERTYELGALVTTEELYKSEMEKLQHQLQGLHEANKNLLDTNDNLREMLDPNQIGNTAYKRTTSTDIDLVTLYKSGASARSASPNLPPRKGSVMSDYVDVMSPGNRPLLQPSFQDEVGMIPHFMTMNNRFESCEEDSIAEELDSGHSTLRDANEFNDDTEIDSVSVHSDLRRARRHRRMKSNLRMPVEEEDESHDEMESDGEDVNSREVEIFRKSSPNHYRSASIGSRGSNQSQRSLNREESLLSQTSRSSRGSSRRQLPAVPKTLNINPVRITKEPDRVYKIVLAGDAAVGKSSFIVRLCKGKFVPNLSSTLGVDFQTKMLEVDGNSTALQLWDTAGQERFRSVARTYFRRADGVLLLYDVTYERSFLNIREWVDAIEENSVKKVPIMLVGNKVDARLELEQQGRRVVKYEDGLKLSKDINALFIETSAKEGSNIHEGVIELTRILRTNEDLEVQTVGLQLTNIKDKKEGSCCRKS